MAEALLQARLENVVLFRNSRALDDISSKL
jgi:hypothetical protein